MLRGSDLTWVLVVMAASICAAGVAAIAGIEWLVEAGHWLPSPAREAPPSGG